MSDKKLPEKTPEDFIQDIQEACSNLGWFIAMNDKENGVEGLVIGNARFLNKTINQLEDVQEYEVWGKEAPDKSELH